jgi:hypothetical protein
MGKLLIFLLSVLVLLFGCAFSLWTYNNQNWSALASLGLTSVLTGVRGLCYTLGID